MFTSAPTAENRARTGPRAFWVLFAIGTFVSIFGVLFAATVAIDHTPDAVIFGIAILLICMSLVMGVAQKQFRLMPLARVAGVVLAVELFICIRLLVDALRHLHTL